MATMRQKQQKQMTQKGSALLAVLWMTVMLSFVAMALSSTVRSETESTRIRAQSEQSYFLARAGIDAAVLRMMSPNPDPKQAEIEQFFREYNFQFATGSVRSEERRVGKECRSRW